MLNSTYFQNMKINQSYPQTKSQKQILSLIKQKKNEDLGILQQVENIFLKKRGYIFKIPPKNTPCIILATGGLDSVIATFLLLKLYKLKLFPLFIDWGQKNLIAERKTFNYFVHFFKKHFPTLYNSPQYISSHIPAQEIYKSRSDVVTLRNTAFANHAISYAKYLKETKNINSKTIFINTVATDSVLCPDTSLTAIRTTNLNICVNENDYSWQLSSLAIEKELGFYLNKEDLIPLVNPFIPLEKTWSCYQGKKKQCGQCFTCWGRKNAFEKANITDKTIYYQSSNLKKLYLKIKRKIITIHHTISAR